MSNNTGDIGDIPSYFAPSRAAEYEAYDALPPRARQLLREAKYQHSALEVWDLYHQHGNWNFVYHIMEQVG